MRVLPGLGRLEELKSKWNILKARHQEYHGTEHPPDWTSCGCPVARDMEDLAFMADAITLDENPLKHGL